MTLFLLILAAIAAGVLVYLGTLDGNYEVRRSVLMKVDRQTLFALNIPIR